jgi:hypothetical protein
VIQVYLRMKTILGVLVILFMSACGQKDSTIQFKEFGWSINLPSEYRIIDSSVAAATLSKGKQNVQNNANGEVDWNSDKTLITAAKNKLNSFTASYNVSPTITKDNWKQKDSIYNALIIQTIVKQVPTKVDTSSTVMFLDGIEFQEQTLSFPFGENKILTAKHLAGFYNKHILIISYTYTEAESGLEIEKMLALSKFTRK